jgi:hypothetical protein
MTKDLLNCTIRIVGNKTSIDFFVISRYPSAKGVHLFGVFLTKDISRKPIWNLDRPQRRRQKNPTCSLYSGATAPCAKVNVDTLIPFPFHGASENPGVTLDKTIFLLPPRPDFGCYQAVVNDSRVG